MASVEELRRLAREQGPERMVNPCRDTRWHFVKDMNCDGVFTISDVGLWLHWVYFLPGDGVVALLLANAQVARFLEVTPELYGGWFSGVLSFIGWFLALALAGWLDELSRSL